jgi:hypothetical protein
MTKNNSLGNFIRLDRMTAKTVMSGGIWFELILVAIMAIVFQNVAPVIGVLIFFLQVYSSSAQFTADHNNMDALYIMLNVPRRTVVLGRYLVMVIYLAGGVALALTATGIAYAIEHFTTLNVGAELALPMIGAMTLAHLISQFAQLPFVFKFGPRMVMQWGQLPVIVLLIGTGFLVNFVGLERLMEALPLVIAGAAAVIIIGAFVSFYLSVRFYTQREF